MQNIMLTTSNRPPANLDGPPDPSKPTSLTIGTFSIDSPKQSWTTNSPWKSGGGGRVAVSSATTTASSSSTASTSHLSVSLPRLRDRDIGRIKANVEINMLRRLLPLPKIHRPFRTLSLELIVPWCLTIPCGNIIPSRSCIGGTKSSLGENF